MSESISELGFETNVVGAEEGCEDGHQNMRLCGGSVGESVGGSDGEREGECEGGEVDVKVGIDDSNADG